MPVIDPEPAEVPVNVTVQLVTPPEVARVQVLLLRLPPVVPAVSVNVTVPVGALDGAVVSVTFARTVAVQLVLVAGTLQLTAPTTVEVLSLVGELFVTVTVADGLLLVL